MKTTISALDFNEAMTTYECGFSYAGGTALFDYLEDYEESCEVELELDPIAIRCEFTEYADLAEIQAEYTHIESLDHLHDETMLIEFDGGIIIANF